MKHKPCVEDLTLAQAETLRKFADENGPRWKSKLSIGWLKAAYPGPLQQIRNDLGPGWLFEFHDIGECNPKNKARFKPNNYPGDESTW